MPKAASPAAMSLRPFKSLANVELLVDMVPPPALKRTGILHADPVSFIDQFFPTAATVLSKKA